METKNNRWRRQFFILYVVSIIAWGLGTGLTAFSVYSYGGMDYTLYAMFAALPGLTFFLIQSIRLQKAPELDAQRMAKTLFIVQLVTGAPGAIGAVLGSPIFAINFLGALSSPIQDWGMNLWMMAPWVSLYGFMVTFLFSFLIYRNRNKVK